MSSTKPDLSSLKDTALGGLHIASELAEIAEFIMMALGVKEVAHARPGEERKKAVLMHLPRLFGIGNKDETLLAVIRAALEKADRVAFDKIIKKLDLDDAIPFIINIASMPNEEGVKEFSDEDRRVIFLKKLIEDANNCARPDDVTEAITSLRANRLLDRSSFTIIQKETEAIILGLLKIGSWNELTTLKIGEAMKSIADSLEELNTERRATSLHGRMKRFLLWFVTFPITVAIINKVCGLDVDKFLKSIPSEIMAWSKS